MKLELKNVSCIYNEGRPFARKAVKNINLHIEEGEFIAVAGSNGAGKTTLIQLIAGLIKPSEGEVYLNGVSVWAKRTPIKEIRKSVGVVFQNPAHQLFESTVFRDVAFGPSNLGLSKKEVENRTKEALRLVDLGEDMWEKPPFTLSAGFKKRVSIAGVIAMEPEAVILDEPTAGLDAEGNNDIMSLIKNLHKTLRLSIILVTHDMNDVAEYARRIVVLDEGSIKEDLLVEDFFENPKLSEIYDLPKPDVCNLLMALKKEGLSVDDKIIREKEAASAIEAAIKGEERCRKA